MLWRIDGRVHCCKVVPVELGHDVESRIREQEPAVRQNSVVLHVRANPGQAAADGGVVSAPVLQALFRRQVCTAGGEENARDHRLGGRTWMGLPRLTSAASISASANVGWA